MEKRFRFLKHKCRRSFSGTTEIPHPCRVKPCQNGGDCKELGGDRFSCTCKPGFTGDYCEKKKPKGKEQKNYNNNNNSNNDNNDNNNNNNNIKTSTKSLLELPPFANSKQTVGQGDLQVFQR